MRTQLWKKKKKGWKLHRKVLFFLQRIFCVDRKKPNAVDDLCLPFAALSKKKKLHRGQTMWAVRLDYIVGHAGLGINSPSSLGYTHIKAHRVIHKCVEALSYSFLFLRVRLGSIAHPQIFRDVDTPPQQYGRSRAACTLKGFASIRNVHGDQPLSIFFFFYFDRFHWKFLLARDGMK